MNKNIAVIARLSTAIAFNARLHVDRRKNVGGGFVAIFAVLVGLLSFTSPAYASVGVWTYAGQNYPNQAAALAAMHAVSASNALLTQLAGISSMGSKLATYQFVAPTAAPTLGQLEYCLIGPAGSTCNSTTPSEQQEEQYYITALNQVNQLGCQIVSGTPASPITDNGYSLGYPNYAYVIPFIPTWATQSCATAEANEKLYLYALFTVSCPANYSVTILAWELSEPPSCTGPPSDSISHVIDECPDNGSLPTTVGDPCDVSTGDFSQTETDYSAVGLSFRRYYHSATLESNHALGVGWTHNYAAYLVLSGGVPVGLLRPNGHHDAIALIGGNYESLSGAAIHIQQSGTNWIAYLKDGRSEVYSSTGQLTQLVTPGGIITTLTYNSNNQLASVADPFGHSLQFGYYSNNQIQQVMDSGGHVISYLYDSNNNLTSATYQDGSVRTYLYENSSFPNNLTGILDESSTRFLTVHYDPTTGAVTSSQQAGGAQAVSITYGTNTAAVTDSLGAVSTYTFTTDSAFAPRVTNFSRNALTQAFAVPTGATDPQRRVTQSTDANGNITTFTYDSNHLTFKTEGYGTPLARTTGYQYLSINSALPTLITEPLRSTSLVYYSGTNNVHTKTITDPATSTWRIWTYTYNSYGQILTIDGPRTDVSDVTTYAYYTCTTGYQCGQIRTITDALGHVTTFNTYNAHGQPLTITDPNGVVTTIAYDARQRVTSRQVGSETTSYSYYPTGLLKLVTLPDSSTIQITYDPAHRLTDITDGLGNHIHYTLDAMGNQLQAFGYDPGGTLRRQHFQAFNALNQLYQDITARNTSAVTTTFAYDNDGNVTSADGPLSRNWGYQYDALNRLSVAMDPNGNNTQFQYTANDGIAKVIDPRTLTTSYGYNGFGDFAPTLGSPDTGTTVNTYDSAGNLSTVTDARGALATYSYDALNRATKVVYSDQTISYSYDAGANGTGRLTSASDANHSMSWTYDANGRVNGKGQTVASVTKAIGYAYTNADLTSLVTPSGQSIVYGYTNHRITSITINGTSLLSGATYDPLGVPTGWNWGNGTTTSRNINGDGIPTIIVAAGVTNTLPVDNASRYTGATDSGLASNSWTFGYDQLDRITSGSSSALTRGYSYDNNGNQLTSTGTVAFTDSVSPTSNQLNSTSGSLVRTYSYDAAGNTKGYTGALFTFNQRGRMSSAQVSAGTTNYVYNALGQMIEKSGYGGTTLLMYDEAGHVQGEYSSTGGLIEETVWMGDLPVATLRPNGSSVSIYYVHSDQIGSPRKVTRPSDNGLMWRWDPDTFGSVAPNGNPAGLGSFVYNLRFPGQYYQVETGLFYNYFRDYDPQTGRYIESDPIGLLGGINTYTYVDDDPINGSDPLGLVQYDKPNPNIGTIICNGNGGVDVQIPANIPPMAEKCYGDCLRAHEISHISDLRRDGPGLCKGVARGMIPTYDTVQQRTLGERKAYDIELACLRKKLEGLTDCDECKKWVDLRIRNVTAKRP